MASRRCGATVMMAPKSRQLAEAERELALEQIRELDHLAWPGIQAGVNKALEDYRSLGVACSFGDWQKNVNAIARAFQPVVATDSQGNAFAVWAQGNGSFDNIWAARYTPGGGWGAPQIIDDQSGNAKSYTLENGKGLTVYV